ncbi:MAG: DJ-1/PfpI family protein [Inconstantimicrobium porci]|uniref:DJ-1/PfpI family protein n=1 Tax=Inconstantimicrobium porci TaxID=2652291 RepID=UPI002A91099B|nr:DJ-1/PfpI family protein [Inconstantimicrobium porci]MDY5913644.1 DJ-1/PfpI family protein [Inconstantimicrobium porci]
MCAGPQYLARASVLNNRHYTTSLTKELNTEFFPSSPFPFTAGTYIDTTVIRDNNIITAQGNCFIDFAIEICDYFGQFKDSTEKIQMAQHYKGMQE